MKLKPCPFCGGKAKLITVSSNNVRAGSSNSINCAWRVICENGCCRTKDYRDNIFRKSDGEIVIEHNGAAEVVSKWNSRIVK